MIKMEGKPLNALRVHLLQLRLLLMDRKYFWRQFMCLAQYVVTPVLPANSCWQYYFCSSRACKQTRVLCFQSLECSLTFRYPLGVVTGDKRKICLNKGQVCHFLTVPRILLHKCAINQEMLLMSLANFQNSRERWEQSRAVRKLWMGSTARHPLCTQNSIRFSVIISSCKFKYSMMAQFLNIYSSAKNTSDYKQLL